MNPSAEALSGWSEAAAVKRNLCEVIHLRDRASGSTMALHDSMPVVSVPAQDPEPSSFCGTSRSAGMKALSGIRPICAGCKKIRDDQGHWQELETYIGAHSDAEFSHGLCPRCARQYNPS